MLETLSYILGIVIMLVGVLFSIAWHELGHLLPAKKFGVRVTKYMVGFGPTLFSRTKGDTEYGIKAIPLGGYIAISGMFAAGEPKKARTFWGRWANEARAQQYKADGNFDEARAFYRLSPLKRIIVMLGGPVMNLILGTVLIGVALLGVGVKQTSTTIETILPCVPVSYLEKTCESGAAESPAKAAGLLGSDKILSVNEVAVSDAVDLYAQLDKLQPVPTPFSVLRDGEELSLMVTPQVAERPTYNPKINDYARNADGSVLLKPKALIGVVMAVQRAPLSLADTSSEAGRVLGQTFVLVGQLPQQIWSVATSTFSTAERPQDAPVSIIGIGQAAGQLASDDNSSLSSKTVSILMMLGSLNYALFVFNLIPLLPLDGGHVLTAVYEAVKRRLYKWFAKRDPGPVDSALAVPFTTAMWFVLMAMSLVVITADIVHPVSIN